MTVIYGAKHKDVMFWGSHCVAAFRHLRLPY